MNLRTSQLQADSQHEAETHELAVARLEESAPARRVFRVIFTGHAHSFEPMLGLGNEERQDQAAHAKHRSNAKSSSPVPVPIFAKSEIYRKHPQ